jgi:hypothetical protein
MLTQDWAKFSQACPNYRVLETLSYQLLGELILQPKGRKSGWVSSLGGAHRRRSGGSKERSPLPWTGAPCSPKRTWAEKDGAQPLPNAFAMWRKDCGQEREALRME